MATESVKERWHKKHNVNLVLHKCSPMSIDVIKNIIQAFSRQTLHSEFSLLQPILRGVDNLVSKFEIALMLKLPNYFMSIDVNMLP